MTRIRLAAASLAFLIASNAWADLRTYDVPPQYQQEVFAALREVLNVPTTEGGRVERLPSGQIVVNAEPEVLDQVELVLKAIRERGVAAAPRVALRYWGVLGVGQSPAAKNVGSPPPAVLNDVLSELRRLQGEVAFRVIGTAAITTNSGQFGEVKGTTLNVEQTAYVQGDTLNANISMQLSGPALPEVASGADNVTVRTVGPVAIRYGNLRLTTMLKRGEFVVLGENHVQAGGIDGPVFYIVHWEE